MALESCCCFSLKTGGLLLCYLGICSSVQIIFWSMGNPIQNALAVLCFAIYVAGVYGIYEKKPWFLVPSAILTSLAASLSVGLFLWVLIAFVFDLADPNLLIQQILHYLVRDDVTNAAKKFSGSMIWIFISILGFVAVLAEYFAKVLFSLFKMMVDEKAAPIARV